MIFMQSITKINTTVKPIHEIDGNTQPLRYSILYSEVSPSKKPFKTSLSFMLIHVGRCWTKSSFHSFSGVAYHVGVPISETRHCIISYPLIAVAMESIMYIVINSLWLKDHLGIYFFNRRFMQEKISRIKTTLKNRVIMVGKPHHTTSICIIQYAFIGMTSKAITKARQVTPGFLLLIDNLSFCIETCICIIIGI